MHGDGWFYSNDPVGYEPKNPVKSFNRYMYVNNNSYKYNDPHGEFLNFVFQATVGAAIEADIQLATDGEITNVTKIFVSAATVAAGVGIANKGAELIKLASAGTSRGVQMATQLGVETSAGVLSNAAETSVNNAIDSVTGLNEIQGIKPGDAAANTLTGNVVDNTLGTGNSKANKVTKTGVEAARKIAEVFINEDQRDK